ncbi:MAG: ATPase [Elusimicrobia bacterium]|nr:ATPase [Elusimicrobiota bacterium]
MTSTKVFAGVDIGSSYTKAVILGADGRPRSSCTLRTGASFEGAASRALKKALNSCALGTGARVVSTGVGRASVARADKRPTEITSIARGSFYHCPRRHVVVDIGGQDNKVVAVDDHGRAVYFKMNRKCAAGTGAFLEEIAHRLAISPGRLSRVAKTARGRVEIGSYCTVFTCTEIIHHIRQGKGAPEILMGCYESVVKRILEMDALEGEVVLSGGVVANHPVVAEIFFEKLGRAPLVPNQPQLVGALGAALLGQESHDKNAQV